MEDLYKILGVDRRASQDEIKKAYREKSKIYHPDNGGNEEDFIILNEAFTILFDGSKRREYDETGTVSSKSSEYSFNQIVYINLEVFLHGFLESLKNSKRVVDVDMVQDDILLNLRYNIKELKQELFKERTNLKNILEFKKRLLSETDNKESSIVFNIIDRNIEEKKSIVKYLKYMRVVNRKMISIFKNFNYEIDKEHSQESIQNLKLPSFMRGFYLE